VFFFVIFPISVNYLLSFGMFVMVWLRPATKAPHGHPSPCWGVEENGKKHAEAGGSGQRQFNRTANKENRNNNDTDKGKTQHKPRNPETALLDCRCRALPSHE